MTTLSPYLLVDVGYLMFYRYYATKLWFRRAHPYEDDEQMVSTPEFGDTYCKRIESCIEELIKTYQTEWGRVYFCCDCRQSTIWRMPHHPSYKSGRQGKAPTGLSTAAKLLHTTIGEISQRQGATLLRVAHAEADDIVYVTRNTIRDYLPSSTFVIVASDADYHQICDASTRLIRLDKKDAMGRSVRNLDGIHPEDAPALDLMVKILSGDASDNIPSVYPKCGPKTALKLAQESIQNPEALRKCFQTHPTAEAQYNRNRLLIDMRNIPEDIQQNIRDDLLG